MVAKAWNDVGKQQQEANQHAKSSTQIKTPKTNEKKQRPDGRKERKKINQLKSNQLNSNHIIVPSSVVVNQAG